MPEQVPNEVQSNQDVNSNGANTKAQAFSCYFPFICHTCKHNSYSCGKLCLVRVAQLEITPLQLVTGIFSCLSLCLVLLFSFSCIVHFLGFSP